MYFLGRGSISHCTWLGIGAAAPATLFLSSSSVEIISHLEYQVAVNCGNHNCGTVAWESIKDGRANRILLLLWELCLSQSKPNILTPRYVQIRGIFYYIFPFSFIPLVLPFLFYSFSPPRLNSKWSSRQQPQNPSHWQRNGFHWFAGWKLEKIASKSHLFNIGYNLIISIVYVFTYLECSNFSRTRE